MVPCAVSAGPKQGALHEPSLHFRHREAEGRGDPSWQSPRTGSPRYARDDGAVFMGPYAVSAGPKQGALHEPSLHLRLREAEDRGDPWWQSPKAGSPRYARDDGAVFMVPCAVSAGPKQGALHEPSRHLRLREAEGRGDPSWQSPLTGSPRCARDDGAGFIAPCALSAAAEHAAFLEAKTGLPRRCAPRKDPRGISRRLGIGA